MVDELRGLNEGLVGDLADSRATHIPELPVIAPTEVASGSGDLTSRVAKAVALAVKQHLGKKALP
eukprot:13901529-Heterocapsa_arctica.AAC.1